MTARILVVDDILPNVKLLEAKLSAEYFDVLTASDGPTAVEIAANETPDRAGPHDADVRCRPMTRRSRCAGRSVAHRVFVPRPTKRFDSKSMARRWPRPVRVGRSHEGASERIAVFVHRNEQIPVDIIDLRVGDPRV